MNGQRLLPGRTWAPAALVAVAGAAATAVLGSRYADNARGGRLDDAVDHRVIDRLLGHHVTLQHLVDLANPAEAAVISAALLVLCLAARRWRGALLVAIAVPLAAGLTEWVLKPAIDRTHQGGLAFPSGHTTGAFAIATVVVVLMLSAHRPPWPLRLLVALGFLAVAGAIAVSLVALGYHYATDTVGGACVATSTVLLVALGLDLAARTRTP